MHYRRLLPIAMFFLFGGNGTTAPTIRSFEVSEYPELNESQTTPGLPDPAAPFVGRISLQTGVTLEYSESGNPDGTPVIFLHGFTDSRHSFNYVVPQLTGNIRSLVI